MSKVVLGQIGYLGSGIDYARIPCQGQPWMSMVVLGQMGYLGPRDNLGYQVEGRRLSNNKSI